LYVNALFFTAASGKPIDLEKKQLLQKAGYEITLMPDKATESLDYLEKTSYSQMTKERNPII
jgi:hypothetical protein